MKTKKQLLLTIISISMLGFCTAQTVETKYYTPAQIQRAETKSETEKKSAKQFSETPQGIAHATVTNNSVVSKPASTTKPNLQPTKQEVVKPNVATAYPDKEKRAEARANVGKTDGKEKWKVSKPSSEPKTNKSGHHVPSHKGSTY
jgi:hypothetical protein